jgi:hypothetical protein
MKPINSLGRAVYCQQQPTSAQLYYFLALAAIIPANDCNGNMSGRDLV